MNKIGLYIHIPFCLKKCAYCDFYSRPDALCEAKRYVDKVCGQLISLSALCADRVCDTVYIGGGTPSILEPSFIEELARCIGAHYKTSPETEFTIEANPATVTRDALDRYRGAGINRISFGVQTYRGETLKRIGRLHNFEEACASVKLARNAGFGNISADLMYALPGQQDDEISLAYRALKELGVTHFSLYGLKIEKNTLFGKDKTLILPDEDAQCAQYLAAADAFETDGYRQYEISNFALPGYESRHNLRYWNREEYLGFGPAAHSFFCGERFEIARDLEGYLNTDDFSLTSPIYVNKRTIGPKEAAEEELMLSLRLKNGYPIQKLYDRAVNKNRTAAYLEQLSAHGMIDLCEDRFALTPRGMLVSNAIISDLMLQTES